MFKSAEKSLLCDSRCAFAPKVCSTIVTEAPVNAYTRTGSIGLIESFAFLVTMQLDIFEDSRDIMLRNDVVCALERREAGAARKAIETLSTEYPGDEILNSLRSLADAIDLCGQAEFGHHDALKCARQILQSITEPAAFHALGSQAGAIWLRPIWRDLALRAKQLSFLPDRAEDHAAPLWLIVKDWGAAISAVKRIESWRRIPAPLAWMAQAHLQLYGLQASWAMLAELAWMSPIRLRAIASTSGDPLLGQLMDKFESDFEGVGDVQDLAWFPAWVLTERPGLVAYLALAHRSEHSAPEQAMRHLVELLGLERQGRHHEAVTKRKLLRDIHPSLFSAYMKSR